MNVLDGPGGGILIAIVAFFLLSFFLCGACRTVQY